MQIRARLLAATLCAFALLGVAHADEPCLDPANELGADGARKGVQKREFTKRLRLEISAFGGFYANDMLSTSYTYGGAIAFYPTESFGIEASVLVTPFSLALEQPLVQFFGGQIFRPSTAYIVTGNVIWAPVHWKMRFADKHIVHGDFFLVLGAGDTINDTVQGLTFDVGFGFKFYPNKWIAIRVDVRDYLMVQEAVSEQRVTNSIAGTLGLSVFIPGMRK